MDFRKDVALDVLASFGNVAQFVSFQPIKCFPDQTFCRVWGYEPNHKFESPAAAIATLLQCSPESSVNVRCFRPGSPRSQEFIYGIKDADTALAHVNRLTAADLYVIVNETIDVTDGGVSGAIEAGVIEFSPDDTPRCVEKPGTASLGVEEGLLLLKTVYGVGIKLPYNNGSRVEFSIHPKRRGYHRTHVLLWEYEEVCTVPQTPSLSWPNNFSRLIGDKAFGLMMASMHGIPVPKSLVISRRIRPFAFGDDTGSGETWLRTCPTEQIPGKFTTIDKWIDPFELLAKEDPNGTNIASVISQSAINADYSGAAIITSDGNLLIEGRKGHGDTFMLGRASPETLPQQVQDSIASINQQLHNFFGPVRFEWVYDGQQAWVVQLHRGSTETSKDVIVPGDASQWIHFETERGIEPLRDLVESLPKDIGVILLGGVGRTSHLADLLRKVKRPARISSKSSDH